MSQKVLSRVNDNIFSYDTAANAFKMPAVMPGAIKDEDASTGSIGQVLTSTGGGWSWAAPVNNITTLQNSTVNYSDTSQIGSISFGPDPDSKTLVYTPATPVNLIQGTGIQISGDYPNKTITNLGLMANSSPTFNGLTVGDSAGETNTPIININHTINTNAVAPIAQVSAVLQGNAGGQFLVKTATASGNLTERLRINNLGAVGFGGGSFGANGRILVSKGAGASPVWQTGVILESTHIRCNEIVMGNIAAETGNNLVGHYVGHPYNYGIRGPYGWSIYTRGFNGPQGVQHIRFLCGESGSGSGAPGSGRNFHPYTYLAGTHIAQYAFTVSSDDRLKHNEVIIDNGLSVIRQMEMKRYQKTEKMFAPDYNGDLDCPYILDAGIIAQDILKIPELSDFVSGGDYVDTSGNNVIERYDVNYNALFTYGLAGVKELDTIVQRQELLIQSLTKSVQELNERIKILETSRL
tara:strand:+ start:272 stop:1669 length:1398 start_codon:yes stop_codon:yes gene_type:complete